MLVAGGVAGPDGHLPRGAEEPAHVGVDESDAETPPGNAEGGRAGDFETQQVVFGISDTDRDRADVAALGVDRFEDVGEVVLLLRVGVGQAAQMAVERGSPDDVQQAVAFVEVLGPPARCVSTRRLNVGAGVLAVGLRGDG